MAHIGTVQSISASRRAQFKQRTQSKKTGQTFRKTGSSQPGRIKKGNTQILQKRRLNIAAFQQQIQAALKSPSQQKSNKEINRSKIRARIKILTNPLSVNRTIKRTSKVNPLISQNRFRIRDSGNAQILLRIKSLGQLAQKDQIKIPDTPHSSFKTGRINLLA